VTPGQEAIQVADFFIEFVVLLRPDRDDTMRTDGLDVGSHLKNPPVRNLLAIPDLHEPEFPLCRGVDEHGRDDEGAEIVALSGFVDADTFNRARWLWSHEMVRAPLEIFLRGTVIYSITCSLVNEP
jgi:hypothetical protein